jgi:hypothetical protein
MVTEREDAQAEINVQIRRIKMKHVIATLTAAGCVLLIASGAAFAAGKTPQTPTTGQRGAPTNTCGASNPATPGAAATAAQGSPFNTTANGGLGGTAGLHYAGNPDTASLAHSNSAAAVSQYDVACVELSMP